MDGLDMAAILALAALCILWIATDARREKQQQAWDDHIESIVTDTDLYPDVDPDIFSRSEAARFDPELLDWSQPATWKETS